MPIMCWLLTCLRKRRPPSSRPLLARKDDDDCSTIRPMKERASSFRAVNEHETAARFWQKSMDTPKWTSLATTQMAERFSTRHQHLIHHIPVIRENSWKSWCFSVI